MSTFVDQPGMNDGGVQTASPHALDLTTATFSLANARELALYARMAYDEPPTIQDKNTDTQVLIRDLGDCIVVAFRGTTNLRDFITDAEAWMIDTIYGKMHYGIYRAWSAVRSDVFDAVLPFGTKPILMGAHSLGGMISMPMALDLRGRQANVHSVYAYGAGRISGADFQARYNACPVPKSPFANLGAATFTVINDCDIVPRMPGYFVGGFRRPGHDEFIPECATCIIEDPSVLFRLGSDFISLVQGWWGKRSPAFLAELLLDHHIDNYIATLAEVEPKEAA